MANQREESQATSEGAITAQGVLETVLSKVKELGSGDGTSRLFPNGIESVDLQMELSEFHLSLKLNGTQTGSIILRAVEEEDDETRISFNTKGHQVIALIAMQDLETRLPDIHEKVLAILDAGDRSVREAAIFPDVIRNQQPQTKPFHFIDIPLKAGGPINPPLPGPPHVLSKIAEFTDFLKGGGGDAQEQVDALSWLFHLLGDVHQPLHCIERISTLHPNGDRGGNAFLLKGKAKNLHSAWDGSVNVIGNKDEEVLVNDIMQAHPRSSMTAELQVKDTEKWARATFSLAKKNAYTLTENPRNPPKPSMTYLKNMEKVGQRQAALGGYRLADQLEAIFT